jgi:hypothetical protein
VHQVLSRTYVLIMVLCCRNLPNGGAARVVCPTCGFECCTKWVLETHIKESHADNSLGGFGLNYENMDFLLLQPQLI